MEDGDNQGQVADLYRCHAASGDGAAMRRLESGLPLWQNRTQQGVAGSH